MDRSLAFYDATRGGLEPCSRLSCPAALGAPLCLAQVPAGVGGAEAAGAPGQRQRQSALAWGDTSGSVLLLHAEPPPPCGERALGPADYALLHQDHRDWVTQLHAVPGAGLVSSSLDATLRLYDAGRGQVSATCALHAKGVRAFAYSDAYSGEQQGGGGGIQSMLAGLSA